MRRASDDGLFDVGWKLLFVHAIGGKALAMSHLRLYGHAVSSQVAASTFYDVHRHYMKRKEAPIGAGALALANDMALKKKKDMEWKRRLILIKGWALS